MGRVRHLRTRVSLVMKREEWSMEKRVESYRRGDSHKERPRERFPLQMLQFQLKAFEVEIFHEIFPCGCLLSVTSQSFCSYSILLV